VNWQAIGAVGEIIGAIAVLVTLIYLARQISHSNRLMRTEARSVFLQGRETALQALYGNDKLIESILKAKKTEELSELDNQRLEYYYRSVFVLWDWEYEQYRAGLLDESPVQRYKSSLDYYPLFKESWSVHKSSLNPKFVQYLETNVFD
jgi:hypothetical protein